jgi:hypothetical protein
MADSFHAMTKMSLSQLNSDITLLQNTINYVPLAKKAKESLHWFTLMESISGKQAPDSPTRTSQSINQITML